jgi:tripartite-type tricarboxylate transporter receptor subunit TctC
MNSSSTLALIVQKKTPLTNEQLTHIARVSIEDPMLIVQAAGPHKTLEQFIKHMRKTRARYRSQLPACLMSTIFSRLGQGGFIRYS